MALSTTDKMKRRAKREIMRYVQSSAFRVGMMKAAGKKHLDLIILGMNASGVNPETGAPGYWELLSERRAKELGRPNSTLKDTGRLIRSLHVVADASGWEIESDVKYAELHQTGGANDEGAHVPARPWNVMPKVWEDAVDDAAAEYAVNQIRARIAQRMKKTG